MGVSATGMSGPLIVAVLLHAFEGDGEGELGFGVGADGGAEAGEFPVKGVEEVGQVEGLKLGSQAIHGFLLNHLVFRLVEETAVMAAEVFVFEGDLATEFAGGELVLA